MLSAPVEPYDLDGTTALLATTGANNNEYYVPPGTVRLPITCSLTRSRCI